MSMVIYQRDGWRVVRMFMPVKTVKPRDKKDLILVVIYSPHSADFTFSALPQQTNFILHG